MFENDTAVTRYLQRLVFFFQSCFSSLIVMMEYGYIHLANAFAQHKPPKCHKKAKYFYKGTYIS